MTEQRLHNPNPDTLPGSLHVQIEAVERQLEELRKGGVATGLDFEELLCSLQTLKKRLDQDMSTGTDVALALSEANMAAAQRIAHFGSWEVEYGPNSDYANVLRWSDEMYRIAGLDPAGPPATNQRFYELVHPDDRTAIQNAVKTALENQTGYEVLHRLIRPNGEERILHERAELIFDEQTGRLRKLIGTAHDVTDARLAEQKLQQSEKWFRQIFNQHFQFMAILDPEGRLVAINDLPLQVGGVKRAEVLGKMFWETVWWQNLPHIKAIWPERLKEAAANSGPLTIDDEFSTQTGEVRQAEATVEAIRNEEGHVDFFVVQASDVTARKQSEIELRRSEKRAEQLWNTTTDAIIIIDEEQKVQFVNPALTSIFGYACEELFTNGMEIIIPERLRVHHNRGLSRYLASGERKLDWRSTEAIGLHNDGHEFPIEISFSHFEAEDRRLFAAFIRDITTRKRAEEQLRQSEEEWKTLTQVLPQLVWTVQTDGTLIHTNQRWVEFTGLTEVESRGAGWHQLLHPDDLEVIMEKWQIAAENEEIYEAEYRLRNADGDYHWMLGRALPMRNTEGVIVRWLGTSTDIHEMRKAQEAIRQSEINLANAQRIAHLGSWVWEFDSQSLQWSDEVFRLFGIPRAELHDPKESFYSFVHPDDLDRVRAALEEALHDGEPFNLEHRILRPDGSVIYVHDQGELEKNASGRPTRMTGTILDITARKRAEEQLIHDALHDSLTGLANRTLLSDRIEIAFQRFLRNEHNFALILVDLDRFKNINDSLGHPVGDQVLIEIANRFVETARSTDTVARLGGDEFAILLEDTTQEDSPTRIAQRLLDVVVRPYEINGNILETGASMGIVIATHLYKSTEQIFRDADIALYRAKDAGRGGYQLFDQEMHRRIQERMEIETDLRQALRRQEMELYLQPIVSLNTGEINSFEALLRWKHAVKGFISPEIFISIAEETGLIRTVGKWVATEACRLLKQWPGGNPPPISINASPCEITPLSAQNPAVETLDQVLEDVLANCGLPPSLIRIEITEGVFISDPVLAAQVLDDLVAKGFRLLLDDFGTGYSSLSYLQDLPFYQVKLDRAFTAKLSEGSRSNELMKGVVTLAHNLGLETVAEGVENEEQLALLRAAGCDHAQGFLISRPLPAAEAYALYQSGKHW